MAIVTTSYPARPGDGAGHFVLSEARAEANRGARVTVLAPGRRQPSPPGANPRVVWLPDHGLFGWPGAMARLAERPTRGIGALRFAWGARRALRRLGPFDRVVAHWIIPNGWPIAASLAARLEVVAHGSDVTLLLGLPEPVRRWIVNGLIERGARCRFVSHALQARLCRGSLAPLLHRSVVAPCPIDLPATQGRAAARAELGLPPDQPLALVAGRLVEGKRTDVALAALTLVPDLRVAVAGDGPIGAQLAARFPSARFLGRLPRPETLLWIEAADVVVSASIDEGAPTVVREARALGTPVVAVPSGDLLAWAAADPGLTLVASTAAPPPAARALRCGSLGLRQGRG